MSDIFEKSIQKPKRSFGDWLFDNFMWVITGVVLACVILAGLSIYLIASDAHEIAREVGGIARSAVDGYNNNNK